MYAEERKSKILEILEKNDRVDIGELSTLFNTSRETIRRDLKELAQKGLLTKTHGGAIPTENSSTWYDMPIGLRESKNSNYKQDICAYVYKSIQDYDTIFLDNSSTVTNMIKYIPKSLHLSVITNSIKVLIEIAKYPSLQWTVISLGGIFDARTLSNRSYVTLNNITMLKPHKAFLSCHGIDNDLYATDSYLDDVEIKKQIISSSREVFLLVDSSKLNRSSVFRLTNVSEFDHIVTDQNADPKFVQRLRENSVDLQIAPFLKNVVE